MTIEKVKSIAKEKYGKDLTDEQAAEYAAKHGKLSDDELDSVAGGGCESGGQKCPECGKDMYISNSLQNKGTVWICPHCGCRYQEGT